MDLEAGHGDPVAAIAQVVFDVAAAQVQLGIDVGELAKDFLRAFADDVREHVEPAAMGHAHYDFANALVAGFFDRQVQQWDQAFGSFQREALGAGEAFLNELLENRGVGEARQDAQLLLFAQGQAVFGAFHPVLQPLADGQVVHVHELHGDRAAVGVAQPLQNPPQRQYVRALDGGCRKWPVHVGRGEAVKLRVELGQVGPRDAQGIDVGHQMPAHAIGPNQLVDAILEQGHLQLAHTGARDAVGPAGRIEHAGAAKRRAELRRRRRAIAHLFEIAPPVGRNRHRVAHVIGVQLLDEAQAEAVGRQFAVAFAVSHVKHGGISNGPVSTPGMVHCSGSGNALWVNRSRGCKGPPRAANLPQWAQDY